VTNLSHKQLQYIMHPWINIEAGVMLRVASSSMHTYIHPSVHYVAIAHPSYINQPYIHTYLRQSSKIWRAVSLNEVSQSGSRYLQWIWSCDNADIILLAILYILCIGLMMGADKRYKHTCIHTLAICASAISHQPYIIHQPSAIYHSSAISHISFIGRPYVPTSAINKSLGGGLLK
jgi:hypothetical protein